MEGELMLDPAFLAAVEAANAELARPVTAAELARIPRLADLPDPDEDQDDEEDD
jgi:hypothetical protein